MVNKTLFSYATNLFSYQEIEMNGFKDSMEMEISKTEEHIDLIRDEKESNDLIDRLTIKLILLNAIYEDFKDDRDTYERGIDNVCFEEFPFTERVAERVENQKV
jgi:hypothetical protein